LIEYKIMTNSIFDDYECPFDIIKYIASFNPETWFRMMRINDAFALYARTDAGKREYIRLFTCRERVNITIQTTLFGRLHSIYDEPSIVYDNETRLWHKNGDLHRDGDLPAVVNESEDYYYEWFQNGLLHRDGDKPAIVDECLKEWYRNGVRHRDGYKPAYKHIDRYHKWFIDGVEIYSEWIK